MVSESTPTPTGVERMFSIDEMIVTKTDLKGYITYANAVFVRMSGYSESELLGRPHNLIRHPEMPRAVFRMLWNTVRSGNEFFGYVKNLAKNGDHYWVFAHVTPHFGGDGTITGYHSSRRFVRRTTIDAVVPIYERLLKEQQSHDTREQGLIASMALFEDMVQRSGCDTYARFVLSL